MRGGGVVGGGGLECPAQALRIWGGPFGPLGVFSRKDAKTQRKTSDGPLALWECFTQRRQNAKVKNLDSRGGAESAEWK